MTADSIQAQYEQLQIVAARFSEQAEQTSQLQMHLQTRIDALRQGGWRGRGADAFFGEMQDEVLPATQRLSVAFGESERLTRQIIEVVQQAEEEAAGLFQGDGTGREEGNGFWGGVGDFFGGMYDEAKDTATGLWNMATDPVGAAQGLWYGITHLGELWDALKQPYVEDWNNGHPWRAIGRGTLAIGTTLLGTKGLDKIAKSLKGSSVVDEVGRVAHVADDGARLINSTGRVLSAPERAVAKMLVGEGRVVKVVAEGSGRTADFLVDNIPTELKTVSNLATRDLSGGLSRRILDGAGQAGHIIVDGRGQAGLTRELAERAIRRAYGADQSARLQEIRIIGQGFDITVPRRP